MLLWYRRTHREKALCAMESTHRCSPSDPSAQSSISTDCTDLRRDQNLPPPHSFTENTSLPSQFLFDIPLVKHHSFFGAAPAAPLQFRGRVGGVFQWGLEMEKFAVLHYGPVLKTVLVELHDNLIRPCSLTR